MQKPSAYTYPPPPHCHTLTLPHSLLAFSCNINTCLHQHSFLFHYSGYPCNSNFRSRLYTHLAVLQYLSPPYPLPISHVYTMLCLYVLCRLTTCMLCTFTTYDFFCYVSDCFPSPSSPSPPLSGCFNYDHQGSD